MTEATASWVRHDVREESSASYATNAAFPNTVTFSLREQDACATKSVRQVYSIGHEALSEDARRAAKALERTAGNVNASPEINVCPAAKTPVLLLAHDDREFVDLL
jgi:uncharacterized iron-regulated protein